MKGSSKYSGYGSVIIPSNISREEYIRRCYDTGRVSIFTYGAGVLSQVSVCNHCWNDIEFPKDIDSKGSTVMYSKIPNREEYVVTGVIRSIGDAGTTSEYQFSVGKFTDHASSSISGSGEGVLSINVYNNETGGQLMINVGSPNADGEMVVSVTGGINSESKRLNMVVSDEVSIGIPKSSSYDGFTMKYKKGDGFSFEDEYGNKIVTSENLISFNDGDNGGVPISSKVADKLNSIENKINEIISVMSSVTIPLAPSGTFPFAPIFQGVQTLINTSEEEIHNEKIKQ